MREERLRPDSLISAMSLTSDLIPRRDLAVIVASMAYNTWFTKLYCKDLRIVSMDLICIWTAVTWQTARFFVILLLFPNVLEL